MVCRVLEKFDASSDFRDDICPEPNSSTFFRTVSRTVKCCLRRSKDPSALQQMKTLCRILCAAVAFTAIAPAVIADDLTPQQALEKFAASAALVKNYDVTLTCTSAELAKTIYEDGDRRRASHYEPLSGSEVRPGRTSTSREVNQDNENFRLEDFRPKTGELRLVLVLNGNQMKTLEIGGPSLPGFISTRGTIENRPADVGRALIKGGRHYASFFANAANAVPYAKVLGQRKTLRHVADVANPEMYVIECQPEKDAAWFPESGWRLALDPLNGHLPAWIEIYNQNMRRLTSRTEILDYKTLPVGIAVPTKMKATAFITGETEFFGKPRQVSEYVVDLEKSRWNCDLDGDVFKVKFPAGAHVEVKTRQ
jgi:hypothetical protein